MEWVQGDIVVEPGGVMYSWPMMRALFFSLPDRRALVEERAAQPTGRTMTAKVTVNDVQRVAELAHLELTADETGRMLTDLNAILDYVAELNEIDTKGIVPLAQVSELEDAAGTTVTRPDEVIVSLDRAAVMPEAPETDGVFFKVPKVIER